MKKIIAASLVAALTIIINPSTTSACSFIAISPETAFDTNAYVFVGKITDLKHDGDLNGTRTVTFDVLADYKGNVGSSVTMTTGANSAMCGFDEGTLSEGDVWVIHTSEKDSFNSMPQNQKFSSQSEAEAELNQYGQKESTSTVSNPVSQPETEEAPVENPDSETEKPIDSGEKTGFWKSIWNFFVSLFN